VVRTADRPVLLVPARCGPRPEIAGDTILVPVDGSPFAELALGRAAEVARELAIPVTVFHAVWYVPSVVEGLAPAFGRVEQMVADASFYVDGLVGTLGRAGIDARAEVAVGPAGAAIRDRADRLNAALIVMATHGRGALGRFMVGSTVHDVLTHIAHPLMLVRPRPAGLAAPAPVSGYQPAGAAT
jgi:nucleotide-binding universal stress UspA family protein